MGKENFENCETFEAKEAKVVSLLEKAESLDMETLEGYQEAVVIGGDIADMLEEIMNEIGTDILDRQFMLAEKLFAAHEKFDN